MAGCRKKAPSISSLTNPVTGTPGWSDTCCISGLPILDAIVRISNASTCRCYALQLICPMLLIDQVTSTTSRASNPSLTTCSIFYLFDSQWPLLDINVLCFVYNAHITPPSYLSGSKDLQQSYHYCIAGL